MVKVRRRAKDGDLTTNEHARVAEAAEHSNVFAPPCAFVSRLRSATRDISMGATFAVPRCFEASSFPSTTLTLSTLTVEVAGAHANFYQRSTFGQCQLFGSLTCFLF